MKKTMCENEMCFGVAEEYELKLIKAIQDAMNEVGDFSNVAEECEDVECEIEELIDDTVDFTLDEVNSVLAKHEIPLLFERCDHCDEILLFEIEE